MSLAFAKKLLKNCSFGIKVEKDTLGQKKTVNEFFFNFIYIVLWDVPNKISKFENRFPGLFKKYSPKELSPL